jgi:hypothetical protein
MISVDGNLLALALLIFTIAAVVLAITARRYYRKLRQDRPQ